jgi:hypothetical protein
MLSERSPISHVAVAKPMADMGLYIIESVVPLVRAIPLANNDAVKSGFWWCSIGVPFSADEKAFYNRQIGVAEYTKLEGIEAQLLGKDVMVEDGLQECAKLVGMGRRLSGVDLGRKAVPADVFLGAQKHPGAKTIFVEFDK